MVDGPDLDRLRAEIDDIDDAIHDRLIRRAEVVIALAAKKDRHGGHGPMRPQREAALIGRRLREHSGPLPSAVIYRIWREILAASLRLQVSTSVAICAPEHSVGYWDLARNHFGSATLMSLHRSPGVVMRAVSSEPGAFGVLPIPPEDDETPWWPQLVDVPEKGPRIIMRLPYFEDQTARFEPLSALVVGSAPFIESGDDVSLLVVAADGQISRPRLAEALRRVSIDGRCTATFGGRRGEGSCLHLIEVSGFLGGSDSRLSELLQAMAPSVTRVAALGGYPRPLRAGELAPAR